MHRHCFRNVSQRKVTFFKLFFAGRELPALIPVEVDVKIAKTGAVTVRLDPELKGRLVEAAVKLDLSENDIVRHSLRAVVNAIEANDYKIELPLEMALAKKANRIPHNQPQRAPGQIRERKTPMNEVVPILSKRNELLERASRIAKVEPTMSAPMNHR
jgi:predicted transcriptional regulator